MTPSEIASKVVSCAVDDVNSQKTEGPPIPNQPETRLLGEDHIIDSLGFAFLIVTVEQYLLDDFDLEIQIFDDEVMEMDFESADNPFATLGSLMNFVADRVSKLKV